MTVLLLSGNPQSSDSKALGYYKRGEEVTEMLLVHLNVNGIQNKFDVLKMLKKELKAVV